MPQPVQQRIPIILAAKASDNNAALVAELCDGWGCGPDDSKSLEKLREGSTTYRDAFAAAGRDPSQLVVRAHQLWCVPTYDPSFRILQRDLGTGTGLASGEET